MLCDICGGLCYPGCSTCSLCGRRVCERCYVPGRGVCRDCERGMMIEKDDADKIIK